MTLYREDISFSLSWGTPDPYQKNLIMTGQINELGSVCKEDEAYL
jgi:hypothetical protein